MNFLEGLGYFILFVSLFVGLVVLLTSIANAIDNKLHPCKFCKASTKQLATYVKNYKKATSCCIDGFELRHRQCTRCLQDFIYDYASKVRNQPINNLAEIIEYGEQHVLLGDYFIPDSSFFYNKVFV